MLPLLFLTLYLIGCTSYQKCSCPGNCYKTPQTPIPSSVLYEAYHGSVIASLLPVEERLIAAYNAQRVLKDGQLNLPYTWESPSSSLNGSFELISFYEEKNTTCFKYRQTLDIDGQTLGAHGIACLDPYQVWHIVNEIPDTNAWLNSDPHHGLKTSPELKTRLSRFFN